MKKEKYMAYVGSYSYRGKAKGISRYEVDLKNGGLSFAGETEVDNSSYLAVSGNRPLLYSIADEGVVTFRILPDGDLERLEAKKINGLRGCHLSVDPEDRYLCVSGYHDGKCTILELDRTGMPYRIKYQFFNEGYGSVADRSFRPHVTCTRLSPDGRYFFSADAGIDQVKIMGIEEEDRLPQVGAIRCEPGTSPRSFRFSADGRFFYLLYEVRNVVEVYSYEEGGRAPVLEKLQEIGSTSGSFNELTAACCMRFSPEQDHLMVSNAGENTVTIFDRDVKTGLLTLKRSLPISGDYPKDIRFFPDGRHLAVANHQSGELSFFSIDYERDLLIMSSRNVPVNQPNCIRFVKL